jgi:UDP-glucuronate 4-epimerase
MNKKILITGCAGFIGFHLTFKLLKEGFTIVGIDNLNKYYDVDLKLNRLEQLGILKDKRNFSGKEVVSNIFVNFKFVKLDITNFKYLSILFKNEKFDIVYNLAAQAGRYSITNPRAYLNSNLIGFFNVLDCSNKFEIEHLIYASSSSVYGENEKIPFDVVDNVDKPISLYAATKKSNELLAFSYSHLFKLKTTGIRFFTVYGPWGRPDMSYFIFANSIINERPINLFNHGNMNRDFTYIDDVTDGLFKLIYFKDNLKVPYNIFNFGNDKMESLLKFVNVLELNLNKKAIINLVPIQKGDVLNTWADIELSRKKLNYNPLFNINEGLSLFCNWYTSYFNNKI